MFTVYVFSDAYCKEHCFTAYRATVNSLKDLNLFYGHMFATAYDKAGKLVADFPAAA